MPGRRDASADRTSSTSCSPSTSVAHRRARPAPQHAGRVPPRPAPLRGVPARPRGSTIRRGREATVLAYVEYLQSARSTTTGARARARVDRAGARRGALVPPVLRRRGARRRRPEPRGRRAARAAGHPEGARRGRGRGAARRGRRRRRPGACATGPSSRRCTRPACASASSSGSTSRDLDLDDGLVRVSRQGRQGAHRPIGRPARAALDARTSLPAGPQLRSTPTRSARERRRRGVPQRARRAATRQGCWEIVRAAGERVGLGDALSPHVLRHSCATHMLDHGADIRVVQELLGHASVSTTQVYTKVSPERLRAVYDAAHPRARIDPTGDAPPGPAVGFWPHGRRRSMRSLRAHLRRSGTHLRDQLAELGLGAGRQRSPSTTASPTRARSPPSGARSRRSPARSLETLAEIEDALAKLDAGTYGRASRAASRSPRRGSRPCRRPGCASTARPSRR